MDDEDDTPAPLYEEKVVSLNLELATRVLSTRIPWKAQGMDAVNVSTGAAR
ncbi:hypothetical protein HUA76_18550 [Myxococcus sp. CA056]|uniref:hypothetical protein n=1 Tax=Myxococcus TaxID=32 RepID=UPI00157B25C2|nr:MULTISPECIES: hypothetical protein [Myxococcus]NTX12798.1 hypothetical protein [Myxococcus sp. CA056]NTX49810.1 hypothetical protein [Myxococcus sp. CA039A]